MIKAITRQLPMPENGKDMSVHIDIDCENAQQALYEYAHITANIRDMILVNSPGSITEKQVRDTVFAAFRNGMENIPYNDKAAAKIKK